MDSLSIFLSTSLPVQIHIVAALTSVAMVPVVLYRNKRDRLHKVTGYIWVISMAVTALSSFWISGIRMIGPFSPIHGLSVFTLFGLFFALRKAIRRNIAEHQKSMRQIATWALGVAGLFAFLPRRLMNEMVFGAQGEAGFASLILVAELGDSYSRYRKARNAAR